MEALGFNASKAEQNNVGSNFSQPKGFLGDRTRKILDLTSIGCLIVDLVGDICDANRAYCELTGFSLTELQTLNLRDLRGSNNALTVTDFLPELAESEKVSFETTLLTREQTSLAVKVEAGFTDREKTLIAAFYHSITERQTIEKSLQESEEHLRKSQKIEAIGRLAGGIAHDFNNFLAVVMLHVDMLDLQLPADSPLRYRVNQIKASTGSAAQMVRQLLAFGRKQMLQPRQVILNHIVTDASKILRRFIGEDVELEIRLEPDLGVCLIDPDQMMQVLMNLVVNARDAMPAGGKLKMHTAAVTIDRNNQKHKSQAFGDYVQLTVADTGIGMDARVQEQIFEPFFTTKEPGKGTGLGLATVYGIVKQSGGFIWIDSAVGKGTTVTIEFPQQPENPNQVRSEDLAVPIPAGKETILLVEDETAIREAATEVLTVLGYQVLEASSGVEALEVIKEFREDSSEPIDLLLTDVVMPHLNGKELAEQIKQFYPEIIVLFMSGYTADIIAQRGVLEENTNFIQKPFAPIFLAVKIREVIEAKAKNSMI